MRQSNKVVHQPQTAMMRGNRFHCACCKRTPVRS